MKQPSRFTMASISPSVGVGIAVLVFAAQASEPWSNTAASALKAPEITERVISQRAVVVAQANQSSRRQTADYSALETPEFANLGQLLNAGGKLISPQQFEEEVVQRTLIGMLPSGAVVELFHASSGAIAGNSVQSSHVVRGAPQNWPVSGSWKIDDSERICVNMQISSGLTSSVMPTRCQFWFKLGERYYVSDSDEDRSAKLFVRVLK